MLISRRPRGGGYGRGAPSNRFTRSWPRFALLVLGIASLLPTGCASFRDPCGGGPFSNCRLFNGGLFQRRTVVATPFASDACGEPFLSVPVETGPGFGAPATVIPAPAAIDLMPAPIESEMLEPIPAPALGTTPTSGRSSPSESNQKTLYETLKPNGGTTTSRPIGSEREPGTMTSTLSSDPLGPLLNLPPLTASSGPESTVSPPVPVGAEPADLALDTHQDSVSRLATTTEELPPRPVESGPISLAPGIARFKVVEAQLAGGSLPNSSGWAFLAEKGYRTALDLRERGKVAPGDDSAALHAGLRYVALPVTPETIGDDLLERFKQEISMADGRPLYFFDDDGARATILWFLKLVVNDGLDPQAALREADELGPKIPEYWLAANVYLNERQAAASRTRTIEAPEAVTPPNGSIPTVELPETFAPDQVFAPEALAPRTDPLAFDSPDFDETRWRPMAAMLLTGLSLPLAYIGRGAFSGRTFRRLTSLPAPVRRRLSLPAKSDA